MPKISLKDFFLKFVSVVDKGDNKGANILLFKSEPEDLKGEEKDEKPKGGNVMSKTYDEILKALPEDEQAIVKAEIEKIKEEAKPKEGTKPKEGVASFDEAEIVKSADPKIQELIEKMKADGEQNATELKKMREEIKKEKVEKTVSQFDKLVASKDELTSLFTKADDETAATLEKVFKAANEQLKDSVVMKEVGSGGGGDESNIEEQVEKEAQELKKSENITIEQARVKVWKKDPTRYAKYLEDQEKGGK